MDQDPIEDKPGSKLEPKLTLKQAKFVEGCAATGNGTKAAKLAGYRGNNNQLAVQASVNLHNPKIQRALAGRLHDMAPHAMKTLEEGMNATKSKAFLDKDGNVVTTAPEPDYRSRLQAVETWFKTWSKCSVDVSEEVGEDAVREQDLSAADRNLLRHAAQIEAKLAETDRELADRHAGDHAAGAHEVGQSRSTTPVSTAPEPAKVDREVADHDAGHDTDHQVEQRSSTVPAGTQTGSVEIDRELAERHAGGHAPGDEVGQSRSTTPVSTEPEPAKIDRGLHDHDGKGDEQAPRALNNARNS